MPDLCCSINEMNNQDLSLAKSHETAVWQLLAACPPLPHPISSVCLHCLLPVALLLHTDPPAQLVRPLQLSALLLLPAWRTAALDSAGNLQCNRQSSAEGNDTSYCDGTATCSSSNLAGNQQELLGRVMAAFVGPKRSNLMSIISGLQPLTHILCCRLSSSMTTLMSSYKTGLQRVN